PPFRIASPACCPLLPPSVRDPAAPAPGCPFVHAVSSALFSHTAADTGRVSSSPARLRPHHPETEAHHPDDQADHHHPHQEADDDRQQPEQGDHGSNTRGDLEQNTSHGSKNTGSGLRKAARLRLF